MGFNPLDHAMPDERRETHVFTEGSTLKELGESFHRFKSTLNANELKRAERDALQTAELKYQTEVLKELKVGQKDIQQTVGSVKEDVHDLKNSTDQLTRRMDKADPYIEKIPVLERWQTNSTRMLWIIITAIVGVIATLVLKK